MKYCHECGTKLEEIEEKHTPILKTKEGTNHRKNRLLNAAGTLVIIATILCSIIGVVGIYFCLELGHDGYYASYPLYNYHPEKLITGIFGLFGLIFGIISGVSIYTRKMFSLALVGLGVLFNAASFSAVLDIAPFIVLGLPILIMGTISTVFTCVSRKEFSS
jgi:cytochrome c oxidase assembly factor CtaG